MINPLRKEAVHCPACERLIYTRRRKDCEWCGKPLPAELLLTKEEIASIDAEIARIERERSDRRAEEEKARAAQKQEAADVAIPFFFISGS
jgi:DNA repair exonuclease SbcCD ATPase subunit